MAGSAGYGVRGLAVGERGHVLRVDVLRHGDHNAGVGFDGICVGGVVEALGLRILGVAEAALNAEGRSESHHGFNEVLSADVLGEHLEVGGFWHLARCASGCARRSGRWGWWSLSQRERG